MAWSQWLILWVQCAVCCGCIAHYKGRNVVGWVALGFCTAILGVAILLFMPRKDDADSGGRWSALELWAFGLPLAMSLSLIVFLSADFVNTNFNSSWRQSDPLYAEASNRLDYLNRRLEKRLKLKQLYLDNGDEKKFLAATVEDGPLLDRKQALSILLGDKQTFQSFHQNYKNFKKKYGEEDSF